MECLCGFSSGTNASFIKHLSRFPDSPLHRRLTPGEVRTREEEEELRKVASITDRWKRVCAEESGGTGYDGRKVVTKPLGAHSEPMRSRRDSDLYQSTFDEQPDILPRCRTDPVSEPIVSKSEHVSKLWQGGKQWNDMVPGNVHVTTSMSLRILLVRHARSENRDRAEGVPASPDPGLTRLGLEQANALGERLSAELYGAGPVLVVTSPARRCLLTIHPAVEQLAAGLPRGAFLCHGAAYEYRAVGIDYRGTVFADIAREFPEYEPVSFMEDEGGSWDYRGSSPKETEPEFRARASRLASWLRNDAPRLLGTLPSTSEVASASQGTIVFTSHQTLLDMLCQILLDGTNAQWEYAAPKYRLQNAGLTELLFKEDGQVRLGWLENDGSHLYGLAKK